MFQFNFLFKSTRYTFLSVSQRWKVRILPIDHLHPSLQVKHEQIPQKNSFVDFASLLHRKDLSLALFKDWLKWKKINHMREDQKYMPERHQALGPDLATTHFLTLRGGKIKFVNNNKWTTYEDIEKKKVPSFYMPGFFIEEIDVSGMNLCYEGFDNLCNLTKFKKLILRNCPFIDDWCLGRSYLFANTLEYLDLSGCELITERGICALHPLKRLKTLIINDTPNIQNRELVCLLLQDVIPGCNIIGVKYDDPILLKRLENYSEAEL